MENKSQDSMELLRSKAPKTDIQVAAGVWSDLLFCCPLSYLSSWWFHLTDTGTLFNEFVDWMDIELATVYNLEL